MDTSELVPEEFRNLSELAHNVWWSWSPEGRAVFSSSIRPSGA